MTSSSAVVDRLHHLDALVSDKDEYDEEENYQPQPPPPPPPDHNHITPLPESTTTPPSSLSPTTTNYFPSDRWSQAEERFLEVFFGKDQVSRFSKRIRSRRLKVGSAGRVVKFDIALQKPIPSKFHTEQQKRRPSSSSSNSTFSTATASLRPSEPYAKIIRPRTANLTKRQRKTLTRFRELDKIVFIRPSSASGLSRGAVAAEGGDGQESSRSPSTSDIDDDASPRRKQSSQHQLQLPPSPTRRNHLFTAKSADGSLKFRPWSGSSNRWMNLGTRVSTSAGKQRNFPIFALPRNVRPLSDETKLLLFSVINEFDDSSFKSALAGGGAMGGRRLETQRQKIPEKKMFYILGEANHPHPSSSSSSSYLVNNSVALHDKQMSDLYKIGMAQSHNYINSQVNKLGSSAPQLVIDTSHLDAERQVILRQLQESGLLPINSSEKHFVINQKFKKLMQRQHHPLPPPPRRLASLINEDIAAVPAAAEEIQHQPQQQHLSHHHHPLLLQRDSSVISTLDVPTTCEQGVGQMFPLDFFMENDSEFILENYSTTSTTTTTTNSSSSHFLLAKCHKLQDRWMQCIVEKYDAKSNAYLVAWTDVMMPYELKDVYKSWITRADMLLTPSESNSRRSFKLKHATALRFDFERCVAIHQFLGLVRPILQDKLPLFPTALVFQMAEKIVETMKSYRLFASTEQEIETIRDIIVSLCEEIKGEYHRCMIEQIVLKNKMFVAFLASCPPLDYTRYVNEAGCSIRYTSYTARISNNLINLGFVKQTAKSIDPFVAMTKHQHITTTVYIMKLEMERSLSVLNIRETLRLSDINHKENISYSTVTAVSQHQRRYSTRRMSANVIPVSKRPLESRLHALPVDRSAYRPSVSSAMQGVHVRNSEVGRFPDELTPLAFNSSHNGSRELLLDPRRFVEILNFLCNKLRQTLKVEVAQSVQAAFITCLEKHGVAGFEMPPEIHGGEEEAEDSRRGGRRYNNNNSIQQSSYSSLNSNASASPQSLSSSATHSVLALVGSIEEEEIKKVGEIKQWWKSFQPHDYYAIHSFFTPDETFDYIRMTISNIAKAQVTLLIGSGMMDLFRLFRHQEATMFLRLEFNTEMRMEESSLRFLDIRFNTSVPDICSQMKRAILALLDPIEFSLPNGFMKYELSNRNLLEELFNEVIDESAEEAKHVLLDLKTSLIPKIVEARKIPTLAKSSSSLSSYTNFITGCRTSKERIKSLLSYIQIFFSANIKRGIFWIQCIDLRHEMEKWCRRLLDDVLPNTIRKAFNTEMAAFLKSFNEFLSMQPVNSLEQTTETAARLEAVKNQMDQIKHHRQGILDLKDFLDSQLLDLRETEYRDFYKVLGAYGDIEKLWQIRDSQLHVAIEKYRIQVSAEISTFLDEWHRYEEIFKKMLEINDQQQSGDHSRPAAGGRMSFGMVGRLSIQHTSSLWKKASSSLVKQQTTKETKESLASALENASTFKVLSTNIAALVTKADSILLKVDALQHVPRSEELEQVSLKMKADQNLLHSVVKLQESLLEWNKSPIATLNPEELQSTTDELLRVINDSDIVMIRQIKRGVNNFLSLQFKIIQLLKYDQFKPWHWERIRDILQYSPFTIESHSVMDVLSKNVKTLNLIDLLKEIQDTAINELRLQKTLNTIHSRLGSLEIELEDFVDSGLVIIKSYDHLINIIEGDILAVGMLDLYSDSHYHDQVKTLESRLALALNYLKEWDQMQPLMVKCFSFFDTEEAKARLVSEMRRFKALQRAYNVLIKNIQNNDQLGALIDEYPEIVSAVINIKEGLGKLFTDIQGWVDNLRMSFPRLYFVSDDELLDLLSVAKDPASIQKHLVKCFDFAELMHKPDGQDHKITGLKGQSGEVLQLINSISTKLSVEIWLSRLESEMQSSLKGLLWSVLQEMKSKDFNPSQFYETYSKKMPGQICILAARVLHTAELETYCKIGQHQTIKRLGIRSKDTIAKLMELASKFDSGVSSVYRSFIALEIYYRDWQHEMHVNKVKNLNSYSWVKGLRYYHHEEEMTVPVRQLINSMNYGFEFLSLKPQVWNELTERTFLTIWLSLESKFGVFAHGNSITGKKTAFLEFARAVGKYILPFTCDSHTSIVVLGRILTGIVTSGVFCIIDKLHTQPLLTISQVVQSISLLRETAQRRESSNVPFFGRIIKIPSPLVLGCFVTIDSASAGAEEISGMLHTQMRAISFIKPAFATIAQGLLAMHCFSQADLLGAKLARLFSMMQDHLSVQNHYDFSLRTLKSVVRYVFRLRQQIKDFDETQVLCRGIAQFMYPKLVYEDVDIFMSLVYRLFNCHPRMAISDDTSISSNYEDPFYKPLKMLNSSDPEEIFQTEILQVSQLSETEQHILLLGASGTGKSTILTKAAAQLKAKIYDLNPTAFPSEVFFGHIDKKGIEVGILETVLDASRKLDPAYRRNWIVFDTEIQESWVDRLCCLVDNFRNATICFSTGKRVGITKNTTLIVETDNLKSSYSYFISRFNIIYVRQEWDVYICIDLWLSSPSLVALVGIEEQGQLRLCFSKYMKDILEGALRLVQIEVGKPALLLAHLRLLETLIQEFKAKYGDDGGRLDERYHEDLFIYSVIWSIGPMISMSKRPVLQQILLQSLIRHKSINAHLVEAMKEFNVESMFDLHFDLEELEWKPFFENISPQSNAADWGVELSKYKQIGRLLLSHQKNLVIVGETGVRKTRIGQEMLEGLKNSASMYYEPITKNSDGGLITLQFQKVLAYDEPTKTYLPPNGNKLILFIDDLQKAKRDDYGTREMWEFLRFTMSKQAFWTKSKAYRSISKVSFLTAVDIPVYSESFIPNRFLRNMSIMYLSEEDAIATTIPCYFKSMINSAVSNNSSMDPSILTDLDKIVASTIALYISLKDKIPKRVESPLKLFSTNDIQRVIEGVVGEVVKPGKQALDLIIPLVWIQECHRIFVNRFSAKEAKMYLTTLKRISGQYFHEENVTSDRFYSELEKVTLISETDSNGVHTFKPIVGRSVFKEHINQKQVAQIIKTIIQSLESKGESIRDISCIPGWIQNFSIIDHTLGQPRSTMLLLSQVGANVIYDTLKIACASRGYTARLFKFLDLEQVKIWKKHFKRAIDEVNSSNQHTVVFCASFAPGTDFLSVFEEMEAFLDGGRIQHLYSNAEYEDFVNKFYANVSKADQETSLNQRQEEGGSSNGGLFVPSILFARHLSLKIKLVLILDGGDSRNLQLFSHTPRIASGSAICLYKRLSLEEIGFYAETRLKSKLDSIPPYVAKVSAEMFYAALQTQESLYCGNSMLKVEELETFLDLILSVLTDSKKRFTKSLENYIFAEASIAQRRQQLTKTFDAAKVRLAYFPDSIRETSARVEELAEKVETLRSSLAAMKVAVAEKEEALSKLVDEKDEELVQIPLEEARKGYQATIKAVQTLKKDDIEEMKASILPPPEVLQISEALCIIFDKPNNWLEAKKLISSNTFVQKVVAFDLNQVTDVKVDKIQKYLDLPILRTERLRNVPLAAKYLCLWLRASNKLVKETKAAKADNAAAGKARKLLEAKISRLNGDRADQERLYEEYRRLSREYKELVVFKRELIGQYAVIKEIFSENSIFDQQESNPNRNISESQWIQQVFHSEEDVAVFSDSDVAEYHEAFQQELKNLANIREQIEEPTGENVIYLRDLKANVESITLVCLKELFNIATPSTFEIRAREVLSHLIDVDNTSSPDLIYRKLNERPIGDIALKSAAFIKTLGNDLIFQRNAFYDRKLVSPTPIAPLQACKGALLIRDLMFTMYRYVISSKGINEALIVAEKMVKQTKEDFDESWYDIYSQNQEFWTLEDITVRLQIVRQKILRVDLTELSAHTQVYCNHPLIHQLLDTACTLSGYKFTHTDNLHSIIQENPSEFLSKLTSFNIEDEAVLQLLNSKVKPLCDYTNLIEYVEEKVSRLFVDIVTMFPSSIKVQVFQYLQHRDICRSACVSKSWNDASTQSAIWKYLCFSKGWGVAFNLPKKMDWKMFYSTIYVDSTEKTASIRSRFTEEMKGTVGMLAYKKMTSFLYHSPEYTNLERVLAHKTQDLKDVVSFEVANECFIAVEDAMTKFLLNEAMSAGHRIASAKDAVNRKTSLRHRLATILFDYTTGFIFKPKQVHSLIMNVAHKFGILSPALEKIRRKLNHGQTTITVSVDIQADEYNPVFLFAPTVETKNTIYLLISEYFKTIYAYHRGITMCKYLQFEDRFYKSLDFLDNQIKKLRIDAAHHIDSLYGDALYKSAIYALSGRFPVKEREVLVERWKKIVVDKTTMDLNDLELNLFEDSEFLSTQFIRISGQITSYFKSGIIFNDPNCVSELIVDFANKNAAGVFDQQICKVEVVDGALDIQLQELSSKIDCNIPIFMKNISNLYENYYELARFRSLRKSNLYLSTKSSSSTNLQERIKDFIFVDLTLDRHTLSAFFLDIIIYASEPPFLKYKNQINSDYKFAKSEVDRELAYVLTKIVEDPNILSKDDIMLNVINLRRNCVKSEQLLTGKRTYIAETKEQLDPYRFLASFVCDIYYIVQNLSNIDKSYKLPDNTFLAILNESIKIIKERNSESFIAASKLVVDLFLDKLCQRVTLSLLRKDQAKFFTAISITKARFYGTCSPECYSFLLESLPLITSVANNHKDGSLSKWIANYTSRIADIQPSAAQFLESMHMDYDDLKKISEIGGMKMDPSVSSLLSIIFSPYSLDVAAARMLKEYNITVKQTNIKAADMFTHDGNQNKLIITFSLQSTIRKIKKTLQNYDRSHIQLSVLSEFDKPDDKWRDKFRFATAAGHWIQITMDSFWLKNISEIIHISKSAANSFRLWIIVPFHFKKSLHSWIFSHCDTLFEEIPDEPSNVASVLISKILDGDIRSNAPLDNVLFFLIRFHTSILKLAKKLPPSLYFDGMDFGLGISTFSAGMKQAAPIKLILEVILQSIYLHDTQSKVTRNQIETLWNQDYEFYEGCFKKKVYDANSFEALFAKIQPVLFPSSSRSGELVHILFDSPIFMDTVGQMSSDLTKLLSCTQEISSTPEFLEDKNGHSLDSSLVLASNSSSSLKIRPQSSYIHPSPATVLNAFEHSLPEDIDLRKFFETERTGDFELEMLLKEEATNIKMMNMETRKILYALLRDVEMMPYGDNVAQVPDHFSKVARLFPNLPKINSSMWIQLVNSVTSNVERWIDYGAPSMINIRSIVSIPAFLDNILVFPNDSREESLLKMGPVAKDFGAENRHLGRVRNILGVQGLALNNALFSSNTIRDIAESRLQFLPPVSFTVVPASVVFESQKGAKSKPVPIAPVTSHASHSTTTAETVSPSLESSQVNSSSSKTPQLQLCKFSILDDRSNWKVSRVMESTTLAHMSIMTHFSPEVLENENISIICRSPEMFVQEETANPSTDGILDGSSASALLGKSRSGGNNTSYVQLITIMICSTIDTENEREYFFTLIAPTIIKAFSSQNILLDFIDFNWGVQSNHTVVERLKAFDIQIKRSDIFMTILGQQLGDRLDSENEEHRPFATLPSKHSQALLKNKNVSLDAISYELEWVFWKIIEANTLNSTITDSLWYVRDKAYSRSVPKSFRDRYTWADVGMERRLDKILSVAEAGDHTRAIREFPCHFSHIENRGAKMGGLDVLGSFIKADLIQSICEVLSRKIHVASNISATLTHGSNTALERTGFSLQGVLERCINHAEEYFFNSQPLTVLSMTIVGGLGSGKSTILDTICKKMEQSGIIVLRSKSTTWNGMIDSEDMIRKMTRDLRSHLLQRSLKFEIPLDTKELEQTMLNLLNLASVQRRRVAVVIDDVDRLKNAKGRDSIRWLPRVFQVSTGIWENTCWLLSASDSSISGTLKESHPNMEFYHLEPLSDNQLDECSQNVQTNGVELNRKTMASFYKRSSSRNLLHLSMITQEMIFMRSKGVLISDLPSTLEELLDIKLLQFEQHELGTKIKKALCSIYTSRNGLREKEIIGVLEISFVHWNLTYNAIEKFLKISSNGLIVPFHEAFGACVKRRYLSTTKDQAYWHKRLADYFIRIIEKDYIQGKDVYKHRFVDSAHHLIKAEEPIKRFVEMISSVKFIEAAYYSELGYELPDLFSTAISRVDRKDGHTLRLLKDFLFFSQVNGANLTGLPEQTFTMALNLRKGAYERVRSDALSISKTRYAPENYLVSFVPSDEFVDFVPIGHHRSKIIRFTVQVFRSWGKCCVSVSDQGTIKAWDMDSYILIETILNKPLAQDSVVDACFYSKAGTEYCALATKIGEAFVYNLKTRKRIHYIQKFYTLGFGGLNMLIGEEMNGLWRVSTEGSSLELITFDDLIASGNSSPNRRAPTTPNVRPTPTHEGSALPTTVAIPPQSSLSTASSNRPKPNAQHHSPSSLVNAPTSIMEKPSSSLPTATSPSSGTLASSQHTNQHHHINQHHPFSQTSSNEDVDEPDMLLFPGLCDAVLVRSFDDQKAVLLSLRFGGIIVINTNQMREICRFKQKLIDRSSIGQFSNSKDLLALSASDKSIMVWRLGNHSRISQIAANNDLFGQIKTIGFSADEKTLICCYQGIKEIMALGDIVTGQWTRALSIHEGCPTDHLCISTSHGEERFFGVKNRHIYYCDLKAIADTLGNNNNSNSLQLDSSSNGATGMKKKHGEAVKKIVLYAGCDGGALSLGYEDVIFFWDRHHNKISYTEKLEFKARVRDIVSIDMLRMLLIACEDKVILYHTPQRQEILQIVHDVEIRKIVVNHLRLNSSEMIMYTVTADDVLYAWQINFNFDTGDHSAYQIFKIDSVQFISDCRWMSDLWIVHKRCYVVLIDGDSGAEKRIFRTWASEAILGIHVSKTYTSRGAAALAAANYGNGNNVLLPASSSSNSSTANNSIASLSSLNGGGGAVGDNTGQFLGTTGTAGRASTRKSTTARTVGSGVSSGAGRHGDSAHSPSSSSSPSPGMLTSGGSEHVAFVTENTLYVDFTIWSFGGTIKDKYQLLDCKFAAPRHTYVGYSAREHPSYIPQHVTQICANQMKPSGAIVILNMATRHRAHLLDHPCEIVFWNFLVHTELSATTLSSTATNTTAGSTGKPYNSAANGATIAGGSSGSGSRTEARWVVSVGSDQVLRVFEIASSHSHSSSSIPSSGRIGSGGRGGTDYAKAAGGSAAMKSKSQSSVPSSPATTTTDPMQDALVNEWLSKSQLVASYSLSWKVTCLVVCSEQPTIFLGDENGEIATYRLVYDRKSAELVQVLK